MILAVFVVLLLLFVVVGLIGWALWLILSTLIVGLVAGFLGRLVVPGRQKIGILATIACGLVGSLAGGAIGRGIGVGRIATILIEIGVAAVAVAIWDYAGPRAVGRRRTTAIDRGPRY